jgi:hypothetical protein
MLLFGVMRLGDFMKDGTTYALRGDIPLVI